METVCWTSLRRTSPTTCQICIAITVERYFEEATKAAGLGLNSLYLGWGCGFLDIDNDSWPDLLYVNGHVYPRDRPARTASRLSTTEKVLLSQCGWRKVSGRYRTSGSGITSLSSARGCAFGDYDNDGDVDVLINPINEAPAAIAMRRAERQPLDQDQAGRDQIKPERDWRSRSLRQRFATPD